MTKKWKALAILGWLALGVSGGFLYAAWNTDGSQLFRIVFGGVGGVVGTLIGCLMAVEKWEAFALVAGLVVGGAVGLVATLNTEGLQLFGMAVGSGLGAITGGAVATQLRAVEKAPS